mgnify:CR=1 FL=1
MRSDRRWRLRWRLASGANRRRKERKDFYHSGIVPWEWGTGGRFIERNNDG